MFDMDVSGPVFFLGGVGGLVIQQRVREFTFIRNLIMMRRRFRKEFAQV